MKWMSFSAMTWLNLRTQWTWITVSLAARLSLSLRFFLPNTNVDESPPIVALKLILWLLFMSNYIQWRSFQELHNALRFKYLSFGDVDLSFNKTCEHLTVLELRWHPRHVYINKFSTIFMASARTLKWGPEIHKPTQWPFFLPVIF